MGASALRPEDARDPQEVRTTETAGQSAGATAADRPDAATMQATTGSATDADWNRDHSAENPNNPGVPARAVETNVDEVVATGDDIVVNAPRFRSHAENLVVCQELSWDILLDSSNGPPLSHILDQKHRFKEPQQPEHQG